MLKNYRTYKDEPPWDEDYLTDDELISMEPDPDDE